MSPQPTPRPFPLADADLCVKCGLCLPHCPTYGQSQNEADSPRGRIMLMQGLATGRIVPSSTLERHLDGCLGCRACERVCPATVPYGALIDAGRALLAEQRPARLKRSRWISAVLSRRPLRRVLAALLRVYGITGLQTLIRRFRLLGHGPLARLESTLPTLTRRASPKRPTIDAPRGTVAIFSGCVGDIADPDLSADLAALLADCGFTASTPAAQTCCGAIDQHAGDPLRAARLASRNLEAFGDGSEPILSLATGCAATLADYPRLVDKGSAFAERLRDPIAFLLEHAEHLRFKPTPLRVAIHEPCTQKNVIRQGDALRRLLARVPELEIVELDAAGRCCGAAGTHFVTHPAEADALLQPKLDAAAQLAPDVIVSANIGCALHLAGGLRRAGGLSPEVLHPLRLLARCRA
ncbi:heterodisulfide reductase-related iron-sulfur binding cluster [Nevskia sp.]|uniref:(Fe-S)-binding protein n=1 Tax=Nevskia sp. TaxID=1929292 RepID=UPI0025CFF5F4|nr:heterodisulfide reductase-related iron-sulfur binding cluster [Nevskia sp.]